MLFPHPSFTDDQLSSLIIRLEVNPPRISYTNSSVRPFRIESALLVVMQPNHVMPEIICLNQMSALK